MPKKDEAPDIAVRIGEFEELVLLAIGFEGGEAFAADVLIAIEDVAKRSCSMGALFTTLERMEAKGLVSSTEVGEEGGRKRKLFKVEGLGQQAIRLAEFARTNLRRKVVT